MKPNQTDHIKSTMTQAEFADLLGVSSRTVSNWRDKGWLVVNGRAGVDVAASIKVIWPNLRRDTGDADLDLNAEKARNTVADTELKQALLRLRQIEIAKAEGELFDREEATKWAQEYVAGVRQFLEGLPDMLERQGCVKAEHVSKVIRIIDSERARLASLVGGSNE